MINEKSYADIIDNISNEDFEKLAKSKEYEKYYNEYLEDTEDPNQKEREDARRYSIEKSYSVLMESWYIEDKVKDKNIKFIEEDEFYRQIGYQKFGDKWVGSFNHKDTKRVNDYYLLMLDSWDKSLIKNIRLKEEEYILRYETDTTKIGGMRPLVKINVIKGLVYFLEDIESDKVEFSKKGSKVTYMNLREDYFKDIKFLKESTIIEELDLKRNEIIIAKNEATHSWEYFYKQNTLYIILDTNTKKLRVAVEEFVKNSEPPVYKDKKIIEVKSDVGTITKPKFAEINKIKKQYNFDRTRASSPMKPDSWEIYIGGKVVDWDLKLQDVFKNEEMLKSLNITLFENINESFSSWDMASAFKDPFRIGVPGKYNNIKTMEIIKELFKNNSIYRDEYSFYGNWARENEEFEIGFNDKNKRNRAMKILNKNLKESDSINESKSKLNKLKKELKNIESDISHLEGFIEKIKSDKYRVNISNQSFDLVTSEKLKELENELDDLINQKEDLEYRIQFPQNESTSKWEEMKNLIKEGKKIKVKRKYTESYPAKYVGNDAKIRNEIIKYLGSNQLMTEDEFEDLLNKSSKHPKLWKKNNPDIYEKCEDGYIRLTKKGKKILDGLTVNEDK